MSNEIKGTIKLIEDTQVVSDKFKKREIVITEPDEKYPQDILFQLTQERVDLLDAFKVGQSVKASYNIRGREWTNPKDGVVKHFNTLEIWKIEVLSKEEGGPDLPF